MRPIHHIVAATDFSDVAGRATERAALIAQQLSAEMHLLHIVHPLDIYPGPELSFGSQRHYGRMQQEAGKKQLDKIAKSLHNKFGIPVQAAARIGRPHIQIADYARSIGPSLVVAGARGENTLLDLLLGSTASRLLRVATCPVLIVRNKHVKPYHEVIAAIDFSGDSIKVPALARTVAPDAHIEALHVFDLVQEARMREIGLDDTKLQKYRDEVLAKVQKDLSSMAAELGDCQMTCHASTGYPPAEICKRAAATEADLIALGRQGKSGLQEFLLGTVSKDVASAAECDVLLCY